MSVTTSPVSTKVDAEAAGPNFVATGKDLLSRTGAPDNITWRRPGTPSPAGAEDNHACRSPKDPSPNGAPDNITWRSRQDLACQDVPLADDVRGYLEHKYPDHLYS